jgi:hypothetical protein
VAAERAVHARLECDRALYELQWCVLLPPHYFVGLRSGITLFVDSEGSGRSTMRLDTHELHDVRFARHGEYPKRHALLVISHSSVSCAGVRTATISHTSMC